MWPNYPLDKEPSRRWIRQKNVCWLSRRRFIRCLKPGAPLGFGTLKIPERNWQSFTCVNSHIWSTPSPSQLKQPKTSHICFLSPFISPCMYLPFRGKYPTTWSPEYIQRNNFLYIISSLTSESNGYCLLSSEPPSVFYCRTIARSVFGKLS